MVEPEGRALPDWIAAWEAALSATAGHSPFEEVYTGPPWDTTASSARAAVQVWKVAVLRRREEGGAEHWGHLFLLLGPGAASWVIRPEGGLGGDPKRPAVRSIPAPEGSPTRIHFRPTSEATADALRAFAVEVQRRFHVQETH
jgi:hypothetical protein